MRSRRRGGWALALVAGWLISGACAGDADVEARGLAVTGEPTELVVAAAASLRDLLTRTAPRFEGAYPHTRLTFVFEASSTLARQIGAGAQVDLFLSADEPTFERVADRMVVGTRQTILANELALVARAGLSEPVTGPAQLAAVAASLVLAAPAVPAGRYARAYLAERGLLEGLEARVITADHVRAALALVEQGVVDYGFVYRTDAALAERARTVWTAPAGEGPAIVYVAGVLAGAHARSSDYLAWLGERGFQDEARALGFLPVPK